MRPLTAHLLSGLVATAFLLSACSSADDTTGSSEQPEVPSVTVTQADESPREDVASALEDFGAPGLPQPLVEAEELQAGGPPPDGIPPIDEPRFLQAADVNFVGDDEPVLAIEINGDARAYPVQIMIWHEIVNDTVGGLPVAVTYCPLCNSAVAVDRRVQGRTLSFGTSGMLYQSSLIMYDRQTESLWSHFTGQAVAGILTGAELESYPVSTVSWKDWLSAHPDGLVLSRDTGSDRDYGRNPYPGYDDVTNPPFLFDGAVDGRLAAKERVIGAGRDTDPIAVRLDALLNDGVIAFEMDGQATVAWALAGTSSALEADRVEDGRDVGATGVFSAVVNGRTLRFKRNQGGFIDIETDSRWNVLGRAVEGPLMGQQLDPLEHVDTFWFAWAAFAPETTVLPAQ